MAEGGAVDENYSLSSALSDDNTRKYECSICLDILSLPKLLPCTHTFCELCLRKHITAKSFIDPVSASGQSCFECPECRSKVDVPVNGAGGFPNNRYIWDEVVRCRQNAKRVCDSCVDRNSGQRERATRYCQDCSNYFCRACCNRHSKLFPSHVASRISASTAADQHPPLAWPESGGGGGSALRRRGGQAAVRGLSPEVRPKQSHCPTHPEELLRFYCRGGGEDEPCNTAICRDCRLTSHFYHPNVVDLPEMAKQSLRQLKENEAEVQTLIGALSRREDFFQDRLKAIGTSKNVVKTLLEARTEKLISKINDYKDRVVARLETDAAQLDEAVKEEMNLTVATQSSLKDTHVGLLNVMHYGSDVERITLAKGMSDLLYGKDRIPEAQFAEQPSTSRGFFLNTDESSIENFSDEQMEVLIGKIVKL